MDVAALEEKATRILVHAAFRAGALDPATFDFLDEEPERVWEVSEFMQWLSN